MLASTRVLQLHLADFRDMYRPGWRHLTQCHKLFPILVFFLPVFTARGMKPKDIASSLEAMHDTTVNRKAVQNAAGAENRIKRKLVQTAAAADKSAERPMDATDLFDDVRRRTAVNNGPPQSVARVASGIVTGVVVARIDDAVSPRESSSSRPRIFFA